jgi:hypothetical protein
MQRKAFRLMLRLRASALAALVAVLGCKAGGKTRTADKAAMPSETFASASAAAVGPCPGTAASEVALSLVLDKIRGAIVSAPDPRVTSRSPDRAPPERFLNNLLTVVRAAPGRDVKVTESRDSDIVKYVMGAQELKWDAIFAYLQEAATAAYPALGKVFTGAGIITDVFTPRDTGFGQAFEFCEDGADPDVARDYVMNLLATYNEAAVRQIAARPGCADHMMAYLTHP